MVWCGVKWSVWCGVVFMLPHHTTLDSLAANIIINFVQFDGRLGISVFCGYVAMVTYFIDAMIVFKKLRSPISAPQSHSGN